MITTKADKLLRSLIDTGLSLTEFTILATKLLKIQRDFKVDNQDRRQRDRLRQEKKLREQYQFEQQLKDEEQRQSQAIKKLRELGYINDDQTQSIPNNNNIINSQIKSDDLLFPYSKEINNIKQKQRDCCLTFNIDYDLRRNQQSLEKACKRAKRSIYELRAERFNHPEYRSVLSVETVTQYNKLKEAIREINRIFADSKSAKDKRYLQELLTYINQFEGDIDLLMCQMQYEPKVKETILFSPVATDILDRMNLILHNVRTLSNQISNDENDSDENLPENLTNDLNNLPTKVTYIIKIKTNDEVSSSLSNDTNVTIKLYGTNNKSPDIRLIQSINKIKWQPGQIDLFNIELSYLGDVYAIEIGHDSQYSSWNVDWIEIIDDGANIYHFPVDKSFDKYSNDKKTRFIIQRDTGPVNRLPTKPTKQLKPYKQLGFSTYTVQVKTGKKPNKATDSRVFVQLKGENGNFSDELCSANSAFKSSVFEPDQLDTFYLIWPYLAKINSLNLLVQSDGDQPAWFCEYITVEDGQTGDKYKFVVNQLFDGSNPDDPNLKRRLTVSPEKTGQKDETEEKDKPAYLMKIKTGEKGLPNLSAIPPINLILKGEKGKSEPYTLKPIDEKKKVFQENQTDEFLIPSKHYIGPIKALQLSSNDQLDKLFIDNIIIRDITQGKDYVFPIYKSTKTQNGTTNLTAQPINERKPDYKVYTRTIASELKGPDRSVKLVVQGTKGKQEIQLDNPVTLNNTFQPGKKDEYYIENMKSLGELKSIDLDITHPNIKKLGLDYVEIKDMATNDSYRFNINRMLDAKNPKMTAKAELIPRAAVNPAASKMSSNQLPVPNTASTMSNKTNFDQITKSTPQGAKRPDNQSKISIKVENESDQSNAVEDNLNKLDIKNKSMSTLDTTQENSFQANKSDLSVASTDKSIAEDNKSSRNNGFKRKPYKPVRDIVREFPKIQFEIFDENGHSMIKEIDRDSVEGDIIKLSIDDDKDFGKFKDLKSTYIGPNSTRKPSPLPYYVHLFDPKANITYCIGCSRDNLVVNDTDQSEVTQSNKQLPDLNIREETKPQGTAFSTAHKSSTSSDPKLTEKVSSENDEENVSLPNQTVASSESQNLSKENDSSLEKLPNRQIRPGDRVKNNSKRKLIDQQSKGSLHEADWYRRSMETNKDHRNDAKQIQLTSEKHISLTKFDQQQANIIKTQQDENQKKDRQLSEEKKINLLPKRTSSRSLKQEKLSSKLSSYNRTDSNDLQTETMNSKSRSKSKLPEKSPVTTKRDEVLNEQQIFKDKSKLTTVHSSSSKQISIDDQKQKGQTKQIHNFNVPADKTIVFESATPSNISELTESSATTTREPSKTSNVSMPKVESYESTIPNSAPLKTRSNFENTDASTGNKQANELPSNSFKNDQKITTSRAYKPLSTQSISAPLKSLTPNDMPKKPSQSAASSISNDQSQQLIKTSSPLPNPTQILYTTSPSATESHLSQLTSTTTTSSTRTENLSNQLSNTSTFNQLPTSISTKPPTNFQRPQLNITDSIINEYNTQPNIQTVSGVTIETSVSKSDSDLSSTQKSDESEHELQMKSLLSPDLAKKSRKNHRQHTSKTSTNTKNEQISNSQPSLTSSDTSITSKKLDSSSSTTDNKYLSMETSNIQSAPRPTSRTIQSYINPVVNEPKTSNTIYEDAISNQYDTYTDEQSTQKTSNIQSFTPSTTSQQMKSNRTISTELHPKDLDISSQSITKPSLNTSVITDNSSTSTMQTQNTKYNQINPELHSPDLDMSSQYTYKSSLKPSTITDNSSTSIDETKYNQTTSELHAKDLDISSQYTSKSSLNTSVTTGKSSVSTFTHQETESNRITDASRARGVDTSSQSISKPSLHTSTTTGNSSISTISTPQEPSFNKTLIESRSKNLPISSQSISKPSLNTSIITTNSSIATPEESDFSEKIIESRSKNLHISSESVSKPSLNTSIITTNSSISTMSTPQEPSFNKTLIESRSKNLPISSQSISKPSINTSVITTNSSISTPQEPNFKKTISESRSKNLHISSESVSKPSLSPSVIIGNSSISVQENKSNQMNPDLHAKDFQMSSQYTSDLSLKPSTTTGSSSISTISAQELNLNKTIAESRTKPVDIPSQAVSKSSSNSPSASTGSSSMSTSLILEDKPNQVASKSLLQGVDIPSQSFDKSFLNPSITVGNSSTSTMSTQKSKSNRTPIEARSKSTNISSQSTSKSSLNPSAVTGNSSVSTLMTQETKSSRSTIESYSKDSNISSQSVSKSSFNPSTTTGNSSISTISAQEMKSKQIINAELQSKDMDIPTQSAFKSSVKPSTATDTPLISTTIAKENGSNKTITGSVPKDSDMSSQNVSKSSLNTSITTGNSSLSMVTSQTPNLSNEISDTKSSTTPKKQSIHSNLSNKFTEIDYMSTVYEESEPSTISMSNTVTSSMTEHDSKQENLQDWVETNSTISSSQQQQQQQNIRSNLPNNQIKSSSKEKSLTNFLSKSLPPSTQRKKTINAKTIIPASKSNTSTEYEFRIQTGNESQLDGTNESVAIEIINTKGQSMIIPLINSMNNAKPFQKGQLDVFHFSVPNNFNAIKKINLVLPETAKDPLHIRYCELQDRRTMNTLYFPIEKWLGEKNVFNVEMYLNNNCLLEF